MQVISLNRLQTRSRFICSAVRHAVPQLSTISQVEIIDALARHISESLDNLSVPAFIEETGSFDFQSAFLGPRSKRLRPGHVMNGW